MLFGKQCGIVTTLEVGKSRSVWRRSTTLMVVNPTPDIAMILGKVEVCDKQIYLLLNYPTVVAVLGLALPAQEILILDWGVAIR